MTTFLSKGFLGLGMSDVGLSKLYEQGAVGSIFGRMYIIPWKFDVTDQYQHYVRGIPQDFLSVLVSVVHRMQHFKVPEPISIHRDGSLSWGKDCLSVEVVEKATQIPAHLLSVLTEEMRTVIGEEAFEWGRIGTFAVLGDRIVCTPNPESNVDRLPPLGRPRHPRMPREK